MPYLFK